MPLDLAATDHGLSLGMRAAHTLAALICGLWLGHGEAEAQSMALAG